MMELDCPLRNRIENSIKKRKLKQGSYIVVYVTKVWNGQNEATAIWFGYNHPLNVFRLATQGPAAIVQACLEAVQIAFRNDIRRLMIKTDVHYVYGSMTDWIHRWKVNGWQTVQGTYVRDRRDFMILDFNCNLLDSVVWELIHTKEDFAQCGIAKRFAAEYLPPIF